MSPKRDWSFKGLGASFALLLFLLFNLGSLSSSMWHVPETEARHANLSRVVDCFTSEIYHSRETGPPEQPQREVRRTLAQSTPSAAPQNLQGRRKPSFSSLFCLANHTSPTRSRLRSEVRSLYPRRCCLRGASGLDQPPKTSQER